ncbi:hypothetical protein VZT92_027660 [Zoarces viviparus]|uniref:Ig-like domain-containing protein n=1 Tax=Zoarces viviparus TaxID=48416 RepID=A0AAW1DUY7_ZOAVI
MSAALTLLLIGSLLQGALCEEFKASMPQTIEVLRGSCVTIPCSFEIYDQYQSQLDNPCRAQWMIDQRTVFNSSDPQTSTNNGKLRGELAKKDCTTTLNNMQPANSNNINNYFFRLECEGLRYTFHEQISISFTYVPPRPTLTPSALKEKEGTSVRLTCSAPAPCLSPPPTLTWTPVLGESVETLQENQDKTKVQTSVVTFTASENHHGKTISCTATYNKQDGRAESAVRKSLTADISYSPKRTTVSVHPSGSAPEGSKVTLTCSSTANPAVKSYTCQIDVQFAPQILSSSDCIKAADQLNCSCRTVGNPSPTLLCLEAQTSDQSHFQDRVMLPVFIAIVVALLVLVCVLLFVNRAQKTHHKRLKSQCTGDTGPVTMSHLLASGEGNEVPNTAEEDIHVNKDALTRADVAHPATTSGPNSTTLPTNEGKDVIYSSVNWRSKKKEEDSMDVHQPGSSYLQEEMCMARGALRGFVSNALEMGSLYDNMDPRNVQKEVESEYAQVKFKDKRAMHK